jgi:hypothetical protein
MPKVKPEKKFKVRIVAKQEVSYVQEVEMTAAEFKQCEAVLDSEKMHDIDGVFSDWINQHEVYSAEPLEVEEFERV